jgi:hypothetical protein
MSEITQKLLSGFGVWKLIQSFSEIEVSPNTLILCDIDDTILHHPAINANWMMIIHNFFHIKYHADNKHHNRQHTEMEINQYLDMVFESIPMRHTDREGFFAMVDGATDVALVTARQPTTKDFTYDNLRCLDIDPEKYAVHFSGNMGKGDYINQHFDLSKYDRVVFIDDQPRNLENVFLRVFHTNLELYQFQYVREESPFYYYPFPPGFNPDLRFDGEGLVDIRQGNHST